MRNQDGAIDDECSASKRARLPKFEDDSSRPKVQSRTGKLVHAEYVGSMYVEQSKESDLIRDITNACQNFCWISCRTEDVPSVMQWSREWEAGASIGQNWQGEQEKEV